MKMRLLLTGKERIQHSEQATKNTMKGQRQEQKRSKFADREISPCDNLQGRMTVVIVKKLLLLLASSMIVLPFLAYHLDYSSAYHDDQVVAPKWSLEERKVRRDERRRIRMQTQIIRRHVNTTLMKYEASHDEIIHIVNTRFMQEQADLIHLGWARLKLFEAFCLPTMISQTIQPQHTSDGNGNMKGSTYKFLWVIKVDPKIDIHIRNRLVELLRPYGNFYLVGSNNNFGIGVKNFGNWRGGEAGSDLLRPDTAIFTGDLSLLRMAHTVRQDRIVLETRLDADDGLPLVFLEEVQTSSRHLLGNGKIDTLDTEIRKQSSSRLSRAKQALLSKRVDDDVKQSQRSMHEGILATAVRPEKRAKWMYWCVSESLNWFPSLSTFFDAKRGWNISSNQLMYGENYPGRLETQADLHQGSPICLTPGLTLGLAVGQSADSVALYSHFDLAHELGIQIIPWSTDNSNAIQGDIATRQRNVSCGLDSSMDCLQLINDTVVLRARTPTSAGMKGIWTEQKIPPSLIEVDAMWRLVERTFSVQREMARGANQYLSEHAVEILKDNLMGQCKTGHSCKKASKHLLLQMIQEFSR